MDQPYWYITYFNEIVYHTMGVIGKDMVDFEKPMSLSFANTPGVAKFYFFGTHQSGGYIAGHSVLRSTPDLLDQLHRLFDVYNDVKQQTLIVHHSHLSVAEVEVHTTSKK